jgi:hypothetical protein
MAATAGNAAAAHPDAWAPVNTHAPCACMGARADVIGTLDGVRAVVEVKTGSMQPTYWWQVALQQRLAAAERGYVLGLAADGTYKLPRRPAWAADVATLWLQLESAARVAQWRLRYDAKAKLSGDGPHALKRADGVRVPGVSSVLRLAGLVDLRDVPADILARAAAKGSMVHRYLEMIYDGQGGLDAASIAPELAGYVCAFWQFIRETGFVVEAVEVPLVWDCAAC